MQSCIWCYECLHDPMVLAAVLGKMNDSMGRKAAAYCYGAFRGEEFPVKHSFSVFWVDFMQFFAAI